MNIFNNISAVIFDCDGVLVDSEKMSCYALNIIFDDKFNIDIGNDYSPVLGRSLDFSLKYYLEKYNLPLDNIEELAELKERSYFELAKNNLTTFPSCEKFIKKLIKNNLKVSVASSGSKRKILFSLTQVQLNQYFPTITSASEVKKGKPSPDIYELAANKVITKPTSCLVIEDTISGVNAAKNAGMKIIGFPGSFNGDDLIKEGAIFVENGYPDIIKLFDEYNLSKNKI